jgi:hypothetical protein
LLELNIIDLGFVLSIDLIGFDDGIDGCNSIEIYAKIIHIGE